jgi:hypothetical protein
MAAGLALPPPPTLAVACADGSVDVLELCTTSSTALEGPPRRQLRRRGVGWGADPAVRLLRPA